MSETFVHHRDPKFIFYVNYKVMFSSLFAVLPRYFPDVERNPERVVANPKEYLKLGVVRNPYARFVSLYVDKCQVDPEAKLQLSEGIFLQPVQGQILEELANLRGQPMSIARTWEDLTNDAEQLEQCRDNFERLRTISFEEFSMVAQLVLERDSADPHFHPQHRRYFEGGRCLLDHLFRLENIEQDWRRICELLRVSMELRQENKTAHLPYQAYYRTSESADTVYQLYERDFVLFSYGRECK